MMITRLFVVGSFHPIIANIQQKPGSSNVGLKNLVIKSFISTHVQVSSNPQFHSSLGQCHKITKLIQQWYQLMDTTVESWRVNEIKTDILMSKHILQGKSCAGMKWSWHLIRSRMAKWNKLKSAHDSKIRQRISTISKVTFIKSANFFRCNNFQHSNQACVSQLVGTSLKESDEWFARWDFLYFCLYRQSNFGFRLDQK